MLRPERTTRGTQQRQKNKTLAHKRIALHSVLNCDASPSCSAAPAHNAIPRAPLCPCRNEENIAVSPIPRVHSDLARQRFAEARRYDHSDVTRCTRSSGHVGPCDSSSVVPPHSKVMGTQNSSVRRHRVCIPQHTMRRVRKHHKPHARRDDVLPSLCSEVPAIRCRRLKSRYTSHQ